jgi:hypothetical protein
MGTAVRGAISGGKGEVREFIWQICTFIYYSEYG